MTTNNNNQAETKTSPFTKGQEVWVKAKIIDESIYGDHIWFTLVAEGDYDHIPEEKIRTTEQIVKEYGDSAPQKNILTEPDRTRRFKKGDKVRLVERWGRPLQDQEDFEDWGFKLNEVYEVAEDEDCDNAIKLINGEHYWYFPFYFLDLVEPAPEPKYWLHVSPKTYSIYYKGQFGRVITAMLMQKALYSLEEAQEQCDKLNQK